MDAPSREVVFAELRKQGIKAIKVIAADGSKANGEIRGVRKRVVGVGAVAIALVVGGVAFWLGRGERPARPQGDGALGDRALPFLSDQTRRQVIGDAAIIEKCIRTGWADVFEREGDRFLASFAIPGVKAGVGTTSVAALEEVLAPSTKHQAPSTRHQAPGIEAQQIKAMVEGMKREARAYIAAGGTVVEYGKRLTERQDAEIAIYERTKSEIENAKKTMKGPDLIAFWEKRNDQLRNLGIKLISLED